MVDISDKIIKGRGAQINTANPFDAFHQEHVHEYYIDEDLSNIKTKYIYTYPKTIVNKVPSPDIPLSYSMNPYQGCEHGCVYCYARNTHTYWGYSAGLDFETVILIKRNAVQLLRKKLMSKSWTGAPIMLSGNTDCYQPVEKKLKMTRKLLRIMYEMRNPVGIITKNKLALRDLDIMKKLSQENLFRAVVSITSYDDILRKKLEPRASAIASRFELVQKLSEHGIPVTVMMAPIIPGLNDTHIFKLLEKAADAGASYASYTLVRLNGDVKAIFEDWLTKMFPDRKDKVMNLIAEIHGGQHNNSSFKTRMKGEGTYAKMIGEQFSIASKRYFNSTDEFEWNREAFAKMRHPQLSLF